MSSPAPSSLPTAAEVIGLHDRLLALPGWPAGEPAPQSDRSLADCWLWVQTNHRFNGRLWAEEDLARRTTVGAADIAANKRAIDGFNQARNDATERVDEILLIALGLVDAASARAISPAFDALVCSNSPCWSEPTSGPKPASICERAKCC